MICNECGSYNAENLTQCKVCGADLKNDDANPATFEPKNASEDGRPSRDFVKAPSWPTRAYAGAPEKPESPSGTATLPDDHKAEDVPTSERKTEDEPHPTYPEQPTSKPAESQPAAGSTNSSGQVYVPGFGYVDSSGDNTVIDGQDIYENGNKIGEMGGGN